VKQQFPILIVEDEENDVLLMERALAKARVTNPLKSVVDGQEAIDYLAGNGKFADRKEYPLPGLILLDLNLPRKSGFEVLEWIRNHSQSNPLLVICSSSGQPKDVNAAYRLGAHGYLRKPATFEDLQAQAQAIRDYWLQYNLPPETETK
jgi:CheY-like chemotaxis protein